MKLSPKYMLVVPALALALSVVACSDDSNNSPSTSVGSGGAVTTGLGGAVTTGLGGAVTTSAGSGAVTSGS